MSSEIIKAAQPYLDERVTVQDAQAIGFCVLGQRRLWRSYKENHPDLLDGLTFEEFVEKGTTVRLLLAMDNQYAYDVVAQALKRIKGE